MNEYIIEHQNIEEKTTEKLNPIITYESYKPDDFLNAPAPDMGFRYSISDPVTGGYIVDPSTNLLATDFIAYSVEYEGEYYGTYNVYREEAEWLEPDEDSIGMIDTYSPATNKILFPQSFEGSGDFDVKNVERDLKTGDLDVTSTFQTTYPTLIIDEYNIDTGEYKVKEEPSKDIYLDEDIYVEANGELVFDDLSLLKPFLFYKVSSTSPDGLEFVEDRKEPQEIKFHVDYSLIDNEELELKFLSYKYPDYSQPEIDDEYLIKDSDNQMERFVIPTNQDSYYNISFSGSSLNKTISVPYEGESGVNLEYENFTFEKLFDNVYEYPTSTNDLLKVSYSDGYNNTMPDNNIVSNLDIEINDYPIENVEVKKRYENDSAIYYVDNKMYYDFENEKVMSGDSSEFENESGLILSGDKLTSGTISFSISIKTYKEYTFNIEMPIGNKNKLRGDNGKYEIEEI